MTAPWRETVAEALAVHQRVLDGPGSCCCGEWPPASHDVPWPDHVADALAPLIERLLTEARAEALQEAADAVARRDGNHLIAALLALPANDTSRDVADWIEGMLRERAARIARTAAQPATSTEGER